MSAFDLTPGILDGSAERAFTRGACVLLAVAVADATGWPLVKVTDAHNVFAPGTATDRCGSGPELRAQPGDAGSGSAMHWMVRRPDGRLVDVDGAHDPLEVIERYNPEADDEEAALGFASREDAIEESEVKGTAIGLRLASTFVAPVLERAARS